MTRPTAYHRDVLEFVRFVLTDDFRKCAFKFGMVFPSNPDLTWNYLVDYLPQFLSVYGGEFYYDVYQDHEQDSD